jgi:hypothetical protein
MVHYRQAEAYRTLQFEIFNSVEAQLANSLATVQFSVRFVNSPLHFLILFAFGVQAPTNTQQPH